MSWYDDWFGSDPSTGTTAQSTPIVPTAPPWAANYKPVMTGNAPGHNQMLANDLAGGGFSTAPAMKTWLDKSFYPAQTYASPGAPSTVVPPKPATPATPATPAAPAAVTWGTPYFRNNQWHVAKNGVDMVFDPDAYHAGKGFVPLGGTMAPTVAPAGPSAVPQYGTGQFHYVTGGDNKQVQLLGRGPTGQNSR